MTEQTPDPVAARLGYLRAALDAAIKQPEAFDLPVMLGDWSRALDALGTVLALTRDQDGNYIPPDCYVPVGGFQSAVVDALTGPPGWTPDPAPDGRAPDYLKTFAEFWAPIVQRPDGTLNFGQIARELADYRDLMSWASEVYCSVTGGRISKVNTLPSAVIGQAEECTAEAVDEAIDDLITDLEDRQQGSYTTEQVVKVIREITGREVVPGG